MNEARFFESLWWDVRYALHAMRKNPLFSTAVVLTIALGIGCNTAMFSVIHAVLLKPLAYQEPERVLILSRGATPVRYDEMKATGQSFTRLGAYAGALEEMALSGVGEPEILRGARITANFLQVLGISPLKGGGFLQQDDASGASSAALISFELWQGRFNGDPQIVGKSITLAGEPHIIRGVMPSGFQFPFPKLDIWLNKALDNPSIPVQSRPLSPVLSLFGRLKPGVTIQQANAE
ncbi:MAG TPA: ABC transporter permease, partial [Terriglobales bacterium]|nr:ABC transporter permease [Terriglobales bacterium]